MCVETKSTTAGPGFCDDPYSALSGASGALPKEESAIAVFHGNGAPSVSDRGDLQAAKSAISAFWYAISRLWTLSRPSMSSLALSAPTAL